MFSGDTLDIFTQIRITFKTILWEPDQTRPDQTRPDQTRPDQTRPDQTRPDQTRPDPNNVLKVLIKWF